MTETDRPSRYFVLHFRLLRFLGLGWWHQPDEENTENFPGWYLYYSIATQVIWVAGFVGLETIDPFVGKKDLDRFMFSLSFVITHNLTLIKLCIFFFRNAQIQAIVRTLEIEMYDYYQNEDKNRKTVRFSKIMTGSFLFFGWMTIGNTNVYGTIQDIKWKAIVANLNDTSERPFRTLPQPIYIPWNYQKDSSFIPTFVLETVGLLWTGHIVMTIDTFIASVILHMSSQFEILHEAITTAYDRTMGTLRQGLHHDAANVPGGESSAIDIDDNSEKIVQSFLSKEEIETALQNTFRVCFKQHQVLIK